MNKSAIERQAFTSSSSSSGTSLEAIVQKIDQLHRSSLQETSIEKLLTLEKRLTALVRTVLSKMIEYGPGKALDYSRRFELMQIRSEACLKLVNLQKKLIELLSTSVKVVGGDVGDLTDQIGALSLNQLSSQTMPKLKTNLDVFIERIASSPSTPPIPLVNPSTTKDFKAIVQLSIREGFIDDIGNDTAKIVTNKLVTTLLYKAQRHAWHSPVCQRIRHLVIGLIEYYQKELNAESTKKLQSGHQNSLKEAISFSSKYHVPRFEEFDRAAFEDYIINQETTNKTFFGSYLSDDSDSDDEKEYEGMPVKPPAPERLLAWAQINKLTYQKGEKRGNLRLIEEGQASERFNLRERSRIYHEEGVDIRKQIQRPQVSRQAKEDLEALNKLIRRGWPLKKAIDELESERSKKGQIFSKFFIAQYRGISYTTTKWNQKSRRAQRRDDDVGKAIYSSSVLKAAGLNPYRYYKHALEELEKSKEKLHTYANLTREILLTLREERAYEHKGYTYRNLAYLIQNVYTQGYDEFHRSIKNHPLIKQLFLNDSNPFVSMGDVPYHALKYAYGLKVYKGHKHERLPPRWNSAGRAERPYSGAMHLSIHPIEDFDQDGPLNVVSLNRTAEIKLKSELQIVSERETCFPGFLPEHRVVFKHIAKYPSFKKKCYKKIYLQKYGITKDLYRKFYRALKRAKPHSPEMKALETTIGEWLCSYQEVKLINIAFEESKKRGGVLIYQDVEGTFSFMPPIDSVNRNASNMTEQIKKPIKEKQRIRSSSGVVSDKEGAFTPIMHRTRIDQIIKVKYDGFTPICSDSLNESISTPLSLMINAVNHDRFLALSHFLSKQFFRGALEEEFNIFDRELGDTHIYVSETLLDFAKRMQKEEAVRLIEASVEQERPFSDSSLWLMEQSFEILFHGLEFGEYESRVSAAFALGKVAKSNRSFIDILLNKMGRSRLLDEGIVIALGESRQRRKEVLSVLRGALNLREDDCDVRFIRFHAAEALAKLGEWSPQVLEVLIESIDGNNTRLSHVVGDPDEGEWEPDPENPQEALVKISLENFLRAEYLQYCIGLLNTKSINRELAELDRLGRLDVDGIFLLMRKCALKDKIASESVVTALENFTKIQKIKKEVREVILASGKIATQAIPESIAHASDSSNLVDILDRIAQDETSTDTRKIATFLTVYLPEIDLLHASTNVPESIRNRLNECPPDSKEHIFAFVEALEFLPTIPPIDVVDIPADNLGEEVDENEKDAVADLMGHKWYSKEVDHVVRIKLFERKGVKTLIEGVTHEDLTIRETFLRALSFLSEKYLCDVEDQSEEGISHVTQNKTAPTRREITRNFFEELLKRREEGKLQMRQGAARALVGCIPINRKMLDLLLENKDFLEPHMIEKLKEADDEAFAKLIEITRDHPLSQISVIKNLGKPEDRDNRSRLEDYFWKNDKTLMYFAAEALSVGHPSSKDEVIGSLRTALNDEDREISIAAALALINFFNEKELEPNLLDPSVWHSLFPTNEDRFFYKSWIYALIVAGNLEDKAVIRVLLRHSKQLSKVIHRFKLPTQKLLQLARLKVICPTRIEKQFSMRVSILSEMDPDCFPIVDDNEPRLNLLADKLIALKINIDVSIFEDFFFGMKELFYYCPREGWKDASGPLVKIGKKNLDRKFMSKLVAKLEDPDKYMRNVAASLLVKLGHVNEKIAGVFIKDIDTSEDSFWEGYLLHFGEILRLLGQKTHLIESPAPKSAQGRRNLAHPSSTDFDGASSSSSVIYPPLQSTRITRKIDPRSLQDSFCDSMEALSLGSTSTYCEDRDVTKNAYNQSSNRRYWYQAADMIAIQSKHLQFDKESFQLLTPMDGESLKDNIDHICEMMEQYPNCLGTYNKGHNHWVVFALIKKEQKVTVLYRDSFGNAQDDAFKEFVTILTQRGYTTQLKVNKEEGQFDGTSCGIHALENMRIICDQINTNPDSFLTNFETFQGFCSQKLANSLRKTRFPNLYMEVVSQQIKEEKINQVILTQIREHHQIELGELEHLLSGSGLNVIRIDANELFDRLQNRGTIAIEIGARLTPHGVNSYEYYYRLCPSTDITIENLRDRLGEVFALDWQNLSNQNEAVVNITPRLCPFPKRDMLVDFERREPVVNHEELMNRLETPFEALSASSDRMTASRASIESLSPDR